MDFIELLNAIFEKERILIGSSAVDAVTTKLRIKLNADGEVVDYHGNDEKLLEQLAEEFAGFSTVAKLPMRLLCMKYGQQHPDFRMPPGILKTTLQAPRRRP